MPEIDPITQAVVCVDPVPGGWRWLLDKPLAGVPVLDRLLLTLQRAGIQRVILWAPHLPPSHRRRVKERLQKDARLHMECTWLPPENPADFPTGFPLAEDQPCLVLAGHTVTTAGTLKKSFQTLAGRGPSAGGFCFEIQGAPAWRVLPGWNPDWQDPLRSGQTLPETRITLEDGFFRTVRDGPSFRAAERALLTHHKSHYTQLLDIHFNAHFSIPLSSMLVRLPVTPNQLTLFGLVIGATAGYFFSRGDYLSGVLGGLLAALTAVWDCCDGDVARLKFMESEFGETLDTFCDNLINVFIFSGLALGVAKTHGTAYALTPFLLLAAGGLAIFGLIYFPGGGKGNFFKQSPLYKTILLLASRNFIYVITLFAFLGRLDWFLWLAGTGALVFAGVLGWERRKLLAANSA